MLFVFSVTPLVQCGAVLGAIVLLVVCLGRWHKHLGSRRAASHPSVSRWLIAGRHTAAQLRRSVVLGHPGCTHDLVGGLQLYVVVVSLHVLVRLSLPSGYLIIFALGDVLAVTHPIVSISCSTVAPVTV